METNPASPGHGTALGRWWGQTPQPSPSTDVMNQLCRVCGEPAAGFHFGAFTCEGCKSFFGRTYNNLGSITECKNNGECVINKKNRTACKACRLRKCLLVGMSKSGSRYGRRSNWFKIHCLLQEQQQQQTGGTVPGHKGSGLWGRSEESKDLLPEETLPLNNNVLGKDREYSAEAAAALWAARSPFLPVPFLPSPFSSFHPPTQRGFLLPFMQGLPQPPTVFSSPSASTCSQTPSPSPHRNSHPPPGSPSVDSSPPTEPQEDSLPKTTENSLAILRALGPVQERPMDLSLRSTERKHRRKNKANRRVADEDRESGLSESEVSECESMDRGLEEEDSGGDSLDNSDENFNRRKDPLDLTKPTRQVT